MLTAVISGQSPPWYLRPWISPALLLALALLLLLPGSATIPMMDRDEPRFANATWEMMERGEWLIPYFNGEYRFDKPILSYWWMRAHYLLLGKTELAARLHSVEAAWLTACVILSLGGFLHSRRAGFWAAAAWLTCLQVLVHGRLCVADMPMLLGVSLTMLGMVRLLVAAEEPPRFGRWFWVTVAGLTIGFLAKGPVAVATPLLALLLGRWAFYREAMPWRRLQPLSLSLISTAAVGLWGIPALAATAGEFGRVGIGRHVVERGLESFNGRVFIPVLPYLLFAAISLAPWSAFFPGAFRREGESLRSLGNSLLLGWFLAPYLIFGLYRTQLPHYVLPGFPAFFLLLFRGGALPQTPGYWFWGLTALSATALLGVEGFFLWGIPWPTELADLKQFLITAVGLLFLLTICAILIRRRRWLLLGAATMAAVLLTAHLGRTLRKIHPVVAIRDQIEGAAAHASWRFNEPSLVFYSHPGWKWHGRMDELPELAAWLEAEPGRVAVLLMREWRLDQQLKVFGLGGAFTAEPKEDYRDPISSAFPKDRFQFAMTQGLNAAKSSWAEVAVVRATQPTKAEGQQTTAVRFFTQLPLR